MSIQLQSSLLIWLYSIGLWLLLTKSSSPSSSSSSSSSMEAIKNELQTVTPLKSSYVNESFLQIKHANYTQVIKWHELPSVLFKSYNQSLVKANLHLHIDTLFQVKFYGEYYKSVDISSNGVVEIGDSDLADMYGWIKVFSAVSKKGVVETINTG